MLIGVASLTLGTVIHTDYQVNKLPQSCRVERSDVPSPSVLNSQLKSIRDQYDAGKIDDKSLLAWIDQTRLDQNKLIGFCSPEFRAQQETLDTDLKMAEAFSLIVREFPHATKTRKRELLEMLMVIMEQRNGMIQKSCGITRLLLRKSNVPAPAAEPRAKTEDFA